MMTDEQLEILCAAIAKIDHGCSVCIEEFIENAAPAFPDVEFHFDDEGLRRKVWYTRNSAK